MMKDSGNDDCLRDSNGKCVVDKPKRLSLEDFPQVFRGKLGNGKIGVTIIYRNHTEDFELVSTYNETDAKTQGQKFDPLHEVNMCRNSGFTRVHGNREQVFF